MLVVSIDEFGGLGFWAPQRYWVRQLAEQEFEGGWCAVVRAARRHGWKCKAESVSSSGARGS